MRNQGIPEDQHLYLLASKLRSRAAWVRLPAVDELQGVDFEQFERPPRIALLLAAMNAPELRDRARDSLTRLLRGLDPDELESVGPDERRMLRVAIKQSRPHLHAEFLIEVARALLKMGDTESIPVLGDLVERTTIRKFLKREFQHGYGTYTTTVERSFSGTRDEEHEVRRVRTAANVGLENLKLLAATRAAGGSLLHPVPPPEPDDLVRPAADSQADPAVLLRTSDSLTLTDTAPVDPWAS